VLVVAAIVLLAVALVLAFIFMPKHKQKIDL
jgi:hypothetical protein